MNHTKCVPFDNTQPTDAKYEHLGKIRYDYVFTQVGGGGKLLYSSSARTSSHLCTGLDLPLPVSQPSVHPLYSPAIGAMLSLVFCACIGMILYVLCNDKQRQYRQSRQHQALPVDSEHATAAAVPPTPSSSSPRHNLHNNDMDVHNVMIMIPSIHEEDP